MKQPFSHWSSFLSKLGYRKERPRHQAKRTRSFEQLEERQLLTVETSIVANDPFAAEAGQDPGVFTISRTGATDQSLTVYYSVSGSANNGSDYVDASSSSMLYGSVDIPIGETSATVSIEPVDDSEAEGLETVHLTLYANSSGDNYTVASSQSTATITIDDDDFTPTVSITANDSQAAEAGQDTGTFLISRDGPTSEPLTVYYFVGGSAIDYSDYNAPPLESLSGMITIEAGHSSATITITPEDDEEQEADETVELTIDHSMGYNYLVSSSQSEATVTITDNGFVPTVSIVASESQTAEMGQQPGEFTITRTGSTNQALTVYYMVDGTADNGADYVGASSVSLSGYVEIPIGHASATISIEALDDAETEPAETVELTIFSSGGSNFIVSSSQSSATVTIADNDLPTVSIAATDPTAAEEGQNSGTFTISRSGPTNQALTVYYSVSGSANNGADYVDASSSSMLSGIVEIPIGETSATITIEPADDAETEPAETVELTISSGSSSFTVSSSQSSATVTIADNDLPTVSIVASESQTAEAGQQPGEFTITRTGSTNQALTVYYMVDGTADNGTDYVEAEYGSMLYGMVEIPIGHASATISIEAVDDAETEPAETVELTIFSSGGSNFIVSSSQSSATVTIADNDLPTVSIAATDSQAAEAGQNSGTFTISRSGPTNQALTVYYSVGGTATGGSDYLDTQSQDVLSGSVVIPIGQANVTVSITPEDDSQYEGIETVTLTLTADANYQIGAVADTVTIADDDKATVSVAAIDSSADEAGLATATLRFDRGVAVAESLLVSYQVTGTAANGVDYVTLTGQVTIAGGTQFTDVVLTPLQDNIFEGAENVIVTILETAQHDPHATSFTTSVTIYDDDPQPTISISDADKLEEHAGQSQLGFNISLSNPSASEITFTWETADGTATIADADYQGVISLGTVIPALATSHTIYVALNGDTKIEADEDFTVTLTGATGATIGQSYATGTITNDDLIHVTLAATDQYGKEATGQVDDPTDVMQFTVSRGEGNTSGDLIVYYSIDVPLQYELAGSSDYAEALTGSVTIADGASSAVITLTPTDDGIKEWDEAVRLTLTSTDNSAVYAIDATHNQATAYLLDNDQIGGLVDRNVDAESTGLRADAITQGPVSIGLEEGQVTLVLALQPHGHMPVYNGDDNLHPIISVEMEIPGSTVPSTIVATLTFGGLAPVTVSFDASALDNTSDPVRFVVLADATTLPAGHYDYDVKFDMHFPLGDLLHRTVRGDTEVVNRKESEFGSRWWINELHQLSPDDGNSARLASLGMAAVGGMALIRGDNTSAWYVSSPVSYTINDEVQTSPGDGWAAGTLGGHDGDYQVATDPSGAATWTFTGLEAGRQYQVFAAWTPDISRTSSADYTIEARPVGAAATVTSKTVSVDQRYTPGETIINGTRWRSLGYYTVTGGQLDVELTSSAGGEVAADAIMLVDDWEYKTPDGSFNQLEHGELEGDETYWADSSYAPEEGQYTLLTKHGTRYEFDVQGLLERRVDRNNNQTAYHYADKDNDTRVDELITIVRQGNLATNYEYNSSGYLEKIIQFDGVRETDILITDGNLVQVTEPDPGVQGAIIPVTEFIYAGPDGQLSQIVDGEEDTTGIAYDTLTYRVRSVFNADGHSWKLTPFLTDGLVREDEEEPIIRRPATDKIGVDDPYSPTFIEARARYEDAEENEWTYQVDSFGLLTARSAPVTVDAPQKDVWSWDRNQHGLAISFTEPAGGGGAKDVPWNELNTTYEYDGRARLRAIRRWRHRRVGLRCGLQPVDHVGRCVGSHHRIQSRFPRQRHPQNRI